MSQSERMVSLILLASELLIVSGAETYRVEETAERMGKAAGFITVDPFTTPTGIFITLVDDQGRVFTRVRRIRWTVNNLAIIAQVNSLSRQFSEGMDIEQLETKLCALKESVVHPSFSQAVVGGIASGAFAIVFGGTTLQALYTIIIGFLILCLYHFGREHLVPRFLITALGGSVAAILGIVGFKLWGFATEITILSAVMVLVPGLAMTTAIRDTISGELISGVTRSAEAATIAVAVAAGVALVLGMWG